MEIEFRPFSDNYEKEKALMPKETIKERAERERNKLDKLFMENEEEFWEYSDYLMERDMKELEEALSED